MKEDLYRVSVFSVPNEDTAQELKLSRIQKDNNDLQRVIKEIEDTLNSFTVSDDHLYCLTTGKAASDDVRNDLLQVMEKGTLWHEEFLSQCKENSERFEEPIKRRKVRNFAHDALKMKIGAKDQKIKEIRCTGDLFWATAIPCCYTECGSGDSTVIPSDPCSTVSLSLEWCYAQNLQVCSNG